ncbi:MAG TPA: DGQHR domain-containing protein [Candidatus Paceibacterota bacterium]
MAEQLKLDAIKVAQKTGPERNIYVASVKVEHLLDGSYFKVNWWDKDKMGSETQGYQRKPAEGRKNKIARFIEKHECPIFPASILVCSHEEIEFDAKSGKMILGTKNKYPMYVVDGQTRIEGFRYAYGELKMEEVLKYEMPVVFLSGFPFIDELEQFYVLNSTQKRVSTDLAQRLKLQLAKKKPDHFKLVYPGQEWELRALTVVDLLHSRTENYWTGRIKLPNTQKSPISIVSQNSFVQSLKPLYKGGILESVKPDEAYKLLAAYWKALGMILPDAFQTPKHYVIQKTPGVFSLHSLANVVLSRAIHNKIEPTGYNLSRLLKKCFDENHDANFWRKDNRDGASRYGSMKGFAILTSIFKANFESNS